MSITNENIYVADFETLSGEHAIKQKKTHVWAWASVELNNLNNIQYGTSITHFMEWCKPKCVNRKWERNKIVYFHNLKWDSNFKFPFLEKLGFEWVEDRSKLKTNSYTANINEMGQYFSLDVCFYKKGKNVQKVTFLDSLKRIPLSVKQIGKTYGLDVQKGDLDYYAYRPSYGYILTPEEKEYIKNDILIVAKALIIQIEQGLVKTTLAGNAMADYKNIIGLNQFKDWFPELIEDQDVFCRLSYKGGFTYLNPKFADQYLYNGKIYDINSLYPSVLYHNILPYGKPYHYKGKYKPFKNYTLYIQHIRTSFKVKEGYLPTIQIKDDGRFCPTEYVTDTGDKVVNLWLTNVDLKLFLEHYDLYNGYIEYIEGFMFQGQKGMFTEYIDKWTKIKEKAKEDVEKGVISAKGLLSLSKLMLNSLYGRFGLNPIKRHKIPYMKNGIIKFETSDPVTKKSVYVPIASFVTAYAREKTIRSAQANIESFIYADTDSLHIHSMNLPSNLEIHRSKLGLWSHDGTFKEAKYLRAKTYLTILHIPLKKHKLKPNKIGTQNKRSFKECVFPFKRVELLAQKVTVAGMPDYLHNQVSMDNFKYGMTFQGKKVPKNVKGGPILVETEFQIIENKFNILDDIAI